MTMPFLQRNADGVILSIRVTPKASRDAILGVVGDELKISLQAPPIQGEANKALVRFLGKTLGVARGRLELVSGESSRRKRVLARDCSLDEIERAFTRLISG